MLLQDSRRDARVSPDGSLVLLEEQDRALWDENEIAEGKAALDRALSLRRPGPYQIQAAIAALHTELDTDWPQIAALYERLLVYLPSPVVQLNRAVAIAMAEGAERGLALIDPLPLERYHLFPPRGPTSFGGSSGATKRRLRTGKPSHSRRARRSGRFSNGGSRSCSLEHLPADVALALRALRNRASAQAEEPFRKQEVDDDREVDDERDDLERGGALRQLVDLERKQQRRGDERQVLRPALHEPQPDRFQTLEHGIRSRDQRNQPQRSRLQRHQPLQLMDEPVLRHMASTAVVGDDAQEEPMQILHVSREDQQEDRQAGEHDEVQRAIDRDQTQHDLVAQRLATQRQLEFFPRRQHAARRPQRRFERHPAVAAHTAIPAQTILLEGDDRVLRPQLLDVGAEEGVAADAAHEQLPVETRKVAPRLLRPGRARTHRAKVHR